MLVIKGPKGTFDHAHARRRVYSIKEDEILVTPVGPTQAGARRLGHAADDGAEPGHRRDEGFTKVLEITGVAIAHRRRAGTSGCSSATATT